MGVVRGEGVVHQLHQLQLPRKNSLTWPMRTEKSLGQAVSKEVCRNQTSRPPVPGIQPSQTVDPVAYSLGKLFHGSQHCGHSLLVAPSFVPQVLQLLPHVSQKSLGRTNFRAQ